VRCATGACARCGSAARLIVFQRSPTPRYFCVVCAGTPASVEAPVARGADARGHAIRAEFRRFERPSSMTRGGA
jgi:hypothetical protein